MLSALFRKITIDNKNYYQLYEIKNDFEKSDDFNDFDNRKNSDYFYIPLNDSNANIFKTSMYSIFTDEENGFSLISNEDFLVIFEKFHEKFPDLDNVVVKMESDLEAQFDLITQDVMFQDEAILDMLQIINRNKEIINSDIPLKSKLLLKDNIIMCGLPGSGKNTIIESLKRNLDVPYADVFLVPDLETNVGRIVLELAKTSNNDLKSMENGVIFIRDNLDELANVNDELLDDPLIPLRNLLNTVKVLVGEEKHEFNLNKLTYVIEMSVPSLTEVEDYLVDIANIPNMHCIILNELTPSQMKKVLLESKNSVINVYRKILKNNNKELKISKTFLDDLILLAKNTGGGINCINDVISEMIKLEWYNDSDVIVLNSRKLKQLMPNEFFAIIDDNSAKKTENVVTSPTEIINDNLDQLVEVVKKTICAQDEHIKRILYITLRNRYAANSKELDNPKRYIKNILIRGESGNGKTAILTEVARILNLPIFFADATSYTEEGYVGASVNDMLKSLLQVANGDLEKAERGILVIDEIDKKAGRGTDSNVTRGAVMDALLKIIEGTKVPIEIGKGFESKKIMFDTSRLTIICSGAFEDIEKIRDARVNTGFKKTIGFGSDNSQSNQNNIKHDPNIIDEDYVNYGMNKQFMARFGVIVNLNKLSIEDHKTIMKNSKTSELVIQKKLSELEGITLTYEESFYDALAQKSYDKKIGARGIERAFQDVLTSINFMDISPVNYQEVIFNGACVSNPREIRLVPREKDKQLVKKIN